MKKLAYLFLPILVFFLVSCEKDTVSPEPGILDITINQTSSVQVPQEIAVKLEKPTPCFSVSNTKKTVSGFTFNYDFTLTNTAEVCADVIAEETVQVTFDPSVAGEYTLNFLINGKQYESRKVTVTE
ncbi:hypothetical protein [Pontibacter cellulosilyticus]|uniref:DUF4625 domain-containing protein n=1 Tax=Pontibacter cellulosilyticus TaxID=1720253 RepID=A0A923SI47_9BACT|nr:hypothetical protein [Pontibacter cellulosilyticus]MBC5992227.1 hypothetical protein [Pontibacter cellulosilyticus]